MKGGIVDDAPDGPGAGGLCREREAEEPVHRARDREGQVHGVRTRCLRHYER